MPREFRREKSQLAICIDSRHRKVKNGQKYYVEDTKNTQHLQDSMSRYFVFDLKGQYLCTLYQRRFEIITEVDQVEKELGNLLIPTPAAEALGLWFSEEPPYFYDI